MPAPWVGAPGLQGVRPPSRDSASPLRHRGWARVLASPATDSGPPEDGSAAPARLAHPCKHILASRESGTSKWCSPSHLELPR